MTTNDQRGSLEPLRVLVVDDEESTRELVVLALSASGFRVEQAADAGQARDRLRVGRHDVVVLDVELPDANGFDLLREIIAGSGIPVVMLTGCETEIDRVLGLELGAEDYVVKPFFPRELATRVRRAAGRGRSSGPDRFEFPGLSIDTATREVSVDGRIVELTNREFDLLAHLATEPRHVFSRADLLLNVWHSSAEWQTSQTVTEHVRRIRHKIDINPRRPSWIKTIAGVGYRFEP